MPNSLILPTQLADTVSVTSFAVNIPIGDSGINQRGPPVVTTQLIPILPPFAPPPYSVRSTTENAHQSNRERVCVCDKNPACKRRDEQKINSFIDAKTRFIDKLDHANIEKNKQHHIEPPKPVPDFQSLISSVITPKVQFITSKIGSLSGSFLGGSSGGGHSGDDDHHGNGGGGGAPQLGNIVSSLLKLSGPILSGSSGSQHGGSNTVSLGDHDDDE
uniref:Uncharacterized protein n=1 Tax=Anopheles maculatus TaxID=74869 RepID=A0A182TA86_9DIPT